MEHFISKERSNSMTKLAETLSKIEEQEEKLLLNALVRATKTYQETPTAQALREYNAAKQAVADYQSRKAAAENPDEQRFQNLLEVTAYLRESGWKVGKTKIYEDQYKITRQTDGTFLRKDVDKYAAAFLRRLDGTDADNDEESLSLQKLRLEIQTAQEKLEKVRRENKIEAGQYISRAEHERALAARAAFLMGELGANFIHSRAVKIIDLVEGNRDRAPELVEYWTHTIAEAFDHYSKPMQFEAPIIGEDEEDIPNEEQEGIETS